MNLDQNVDVVIIWVDGNNPDWKKRYAEYSNTNLNGDKRIVRFRDWNLLKFWFRGIEQFAPWARKIHFVTSGEKPEWLNLDCEKLNWVKHEDYIPAEFLPTFSANVIETNLHRIAELSERFVYFNDDTLLIKKTKPTDFFKKGLPCDFAILDPIPPQAYPGIFVNGTIVLNRNFEKNKVISKNLFKWINIKYGKYLAKSLLLMPWKKFPGLLSAHLAQPLCKSTIEEVWRAEPELLHKTGTARFRTSDDVNQWLFRYWHLAKGDFHPTNTLKKGRFFEINTNTLDEICSVIEHQKYMQICVNDAVDIDNFEMMSEKLQLAFESILPNKSAFEK